MQFPHKKQQVRLRFLQRLFKIDTNAGKFILFNELCQRGNQPLTRVSVGHVSGQHVALPLFVVQVLHHWQNLSLRPFLANQVQCLQRLGIVKLIFDRTHAGLGIDDVRPLGQDPIEVIEIPFQRRVTRLVPVNIKTDTQWL